VTLPSIFVRQGDLLRSSSGFRLLFSSALISGLGTWIAVIALTLDVAQRTDHSGVWVAALLIADFLPAVAIGLLLGPLVDRFSRKLLLVAADLIRLGVFVALVLADRPWQIVALAFLAGIATGFARPAAYAGLPNLVQPELLPRATSLMRTAEQLTIMIGTLFGGVIVAASGPDLAYSMNAASFLLSVSLLVRISGGVLQRGHVESHGHWRDVAEGIHVVRQSGQLMTVLVSWNLAMVTIALVNVSEVFLATVSFNAGSFGFGLLWAGSGLGAVVGALFASSLLERWSMTVLYALAIALMGLADIAAAVSPNVWVAVWCVLVGGVGNATALVSNTLLVQRGAPDQVRGRAFTLIMGSNFAVLGVGMAIAGPLVDVVGARWVYGIAGGIAFVSALTGYTMLRRAREPVPEPAAL
jgi:DHA3 family macrolide efflux protein-like MFS transporter